MNNNKSNNLWNIGIFALVICFCLIAAGCDSQQIRVIEVEPYVERKHGQFLDLRNCQDDTDLQVSFSSHISVQNHIQLADQASVVATGEVITIPEETKTLIEAQIERAYQQKYIEAKDQIEQIELTVPVGKIHMYNVSWLVNIFESKVSYSENRTTYEAAYIYELIIPQLSGFMEISCTG